MKTSNNRLPRSCLRLMAFLPVAGLIGAFCVLTTFGEPPGGAIALPNWLTSIHPFYTHNTLFEPALLGRWTLDDNADAIFIFQKQGTNAYELQFLSTKVQWQGTNVISRTCTTNVMSAHLFKLHGERFLDVLGPETTQDMFPPDAVPCHMLFRIHAIAPILRMSPIDADWALSFLQSKPKLVQHVLIGDRVVLTAPSEKMPGFILKILGNPDAWGKGMDDSVLAFSRS